MVLSWFLSSPSGNGANPKKYQNKAYTMQNAKQQEVFY
jgi:hypothetical protein